MIVPPSFAIHLSSYQLLYHVFPLFQFHPPLSFSIFPIFSRAKPKCSQATCPTHHHCINRSPSMKLLASSSSLTQTEPDVGTSSPPIMCSRVDFPLPDVPTTATNSPCSTKKDTPSRAWAMWLSQLLFLHWRKNTI